VDFRHRVRIDALFGPEEELLCGLERLVVAFHPNWDRCFFYDRRSKKMLIMSCDMKERRVRVIRTLEGVADEVHPFFSCMSHCTMLGR
jgi:hypothetical protein